MNARILPVLVAVIGLGSLGAGHVAAEAKVRAGEPLKVSITRSSQIERVLSGWSPEARAAAHKMIQRCGMPQQVSETAIVWDADGRAECDPSAAGIPPEDPGMESQAKAAN